MSAQVTFSLNDRYAMKMWNPIILKDDSIRSITGEHFFNVIYSVHRELNDDQSSVVHDANVLLENFQKEILSLDNFYQGLIRGCEIKKQESCFNISFTSNAKHPINFTPNKNSGLCPENALFLKVFIRFDEYISLLNELRSMYIITPKEFDLDRRIASRKIHGVMEGFNILIKNFHKDRKNAKKSNDKVA